MQINLITPANQRTTKRIWGVHGHFFITILSIWFVVIAGMLLISFLANSAQTKLNTTRTELSQNNEIITKKANLEQMIAQYELKEQLIKKQDEAKIPWSKVLDDLSIILGVNGISPKDNSPRPLVTLTMLAVSEEKLDHTYNLTMEGWARNFEDLAKIQRNLQGFYFEDDDKKLFKYQNARLMQGEIVVDPKTLARVLTFKITVVMPKEVIKK